MRRTRRFAATALMVALVLATTTACDAPPPPLVIIDTVAGTGAGGFSGDGGPAASAQLSRPFGVAADGGGTLYIADTVNHRVRKVDTDGTISTVAGNGTNGFSGDGSAATGAQLFQPQSLAVDGVGNLYIADTGNQRIRKVDDDGVITTVAGSGVLGFSGDDGPAIEAAFRYPVGVSVDGSGNLYVADQHNHRIRKVDTDGVISTVAGSGVQGFSGDGGAATSAQLNYPEGVEAGADGNLYVADTANHRVRKVDPSGTITTFAGTGISAYYGDGGPATDAGLYSPRGLALDSRGILAIADRSNNAVRAVMPNGTIATVAGFASAPGWPPSSGFEGDGNVPTRAVLYFPQDVAVDPSGALYIADERNNRVRKIWPGGGAIGGRVVADDGGAGIGGLTVNVYASSDLDTPVATTTTSARGYYGFSLVTGHYTIEVEGGSGYVGEWFDDAPDGSSATSIEVTEGGQHDVDLGLAG